MTVILEKCIYGLVQVAQQYNKKTVEVLKNICFTRINVDPCFFMKKSAKGIVNVAFCIDDNLMLGSTEAIDKALEQIKRMSWC